MKTKVKVKWDINQEPLFKGDEGYIDGYVQAGDGRAYAAVVVNDKMGLAMVHELEPTGIMYPYPMDLYKDK